MQGYKSVLYIWVTRHMSSVLEQYTLMMWTLQWNLAKPNLINPKPCLSDTFFWGGGGGGGLFKGDLVFIKLHELP